jgi:uncharacterized protein YoxC
MIEKVKLRMKEIESATNELVNDINKKVAELNKMTKQLDEFNGEYVGLKNLLNSENSVPKAD